MANLNESDRIAGPGTQTGSGVVVSTGKVVFDGSATALPDAGSFDKDRVFDSTTFDPDPLYLAALHNIVSVRPQPRFLSISLQADSVTVQIENGAGTWRIESSELLDGTAWQLVDRVSSPSGGTVSVVDTGQNGRVKPGSVSHRYYRIRSE